MRDNQVGLTLTKQCACEGAGGSGPRVVQVGARDTSTGTRFEFDFVLMACDVCNRPWAVTDSPPARPGGAG